MWLAIFMALFFCSVPFIAGMIYESQRQRHQ